MKSNRILIIGIFSIGLIASSSCSKDDLGETPSSEINEQIIDLSSHQIYLNGQSTDQTIQGDNVISVMDCENSITYQFTNDQLFKNWSNNRAMLKTTNGVNLYEVYSDLQEIAKLAEDLGLIDTYEFGDELPDEMLEKLEELGYTDNHNEKAATATITTLYDDTYWINSLVTITTFVPALAPVHRNKTESMKLIGVNGTWYCDKTWFRGEKRYFITLTHYYLPDFLDFNNKIESIFSVS
jgi:hypothetical protein